jgi:murein DD-endopeptidase MepM/ murein hydrolase activator NlpD
MKRMRLTTAKKAGFSHNMLRKRKELSRQTIGYMKQKSSFLVAAFSLGAFITGNMLGQHGWYAFWKAALGQYDDALITYTGTVSPVALVPDYTKWSTYGGNGEEHTFRQVPKDALIPLPAYVSSTEKKDYDHSPAGDVFSIGHMGSYETGAEGDGSHIGVDIRVPQGTPILSIANGIVEQVREDKSGFGKLIVIRHPHSPNPDDPQYETVLHSVYAHLSSQLVSEGDIVKKGQQIGLSGKTGFATGPHLHFQVDRDDAPWHPYWAFSYTEASAAGMNTAQAIDAGLHKERGYEYSVNPMLYVQANYPAAKYKDTGTIAKKTQPEKGGTKTVSRPSTRRTVTGKDIGNSVANRKAQRVATRGTAVAAASSASSLSTSVSSVMPVVTSTETVASGTQSAPPASAPVHVTPSASPVTSVDIETAPTFTERQWMTVRIRLLDENGKTASSEGLKKDIYMRTAYGEAEFDPPILSSLDFRNGVAEVKMLPRGRRTVVILAQPMGVQSRPIEYK